MLTSIFAFVKKNRSTNYDAKQHQLILNPKVVLELNCFPETAIIFWTGYSRQGGYKRNMNVMPIPEIIEKVTKICKKNGVKRLDLFGSFATGTAAPTSDIDFVVYGCDNLLQLEDDLLQIETLRKIDIFDFDSIRNEYLLEDIKKYGKQIY